MTNPFMMKKRKFNNQIGAPVETLDVILKLREAIAQ